MEEFPVDFADMKAAFYRGEFTQVITELDSLRRHFLPEQLPTSVFVYGGLARYYSGDFVGAIRQYEQAIRIDDECGAALSNLAYIYACCPDKGFHDAATAVALAERASELSNWSDGNCIEVLAAAHARGGDFSKAESYLLLAQELGPPNKQEGLRKLLEMVRLRQAICGDVFEDFKRCQRDFGDSSEP
ncbi:hypothetical protein NG895_22415 [Aeoliella sp. ICT_H6.2]|uniref:Tetratricopeptide repeat protein n=1 Tax=Aeoliella straminimaris TaxID=2954799 RepID=A0A9X2FDK7_9BACT|nr:hypothetical protein [Aeoliella straminimaris]MCO6046659.1 hypothetical protein [Aeoliella straminimaris]